MVLTRRQFLGLSSVVGGLLLTGVRVPVTAQEVDTDFDFPLEFPTASFSATELDRQPLSASLLSLRSLSFWERLFSK
jgi:hypothetical protein